MRMGIEMEKRTRKPIAYWLNMSEDPLYGSYTFSPQIGSKFERVGAEKIIQVYFRPDGTIPWHALEGSSNASPKTASDVSKKEIVA